MPFSVISLATSSVSWSTTQIASDARLDTYSRPVTRDCGHMKWLRRQRYVPDLTAVNANYRQQVFTIAADEQFISVARKVDPVWRIPSRVGLTAGERPRGAHTTDLAKEDALAPSNLPTRIRLEAVIFILNLFLIPSYTLISVIRAEKRRACIQRAGQDLDISKLLVPYAPASALQFKSV